jgi:prevent-host-death family protein
MSQRADVKPITYLKNRTADLLREVSEGGHAVTITQNGEARAVLMDVDTYDRWRSAMALLKLLAQGEADVEAGRTVKHSDVFRRARKAIERSASDG